jgi:N-acetylglucosaminyldiphosphoundecaprenol N-acetyl-beta-D-mannosaminyltransferase
MPPTATVCGYRCLALPPAEIGRFLLDRIAAGQGGWVLTLNLEMISRAAKSREYGDLTRGADLIFADGMPVVWAANLRRRGARIPGRAAGVDVSAELIRATGAARLAIIGGEDPRRALEALGVADHEAAFVYDGQVVADEATADALAAELRARGSRLVFLALGAGKQDVLADLLRRRAPEALILGVGGTFELIAGRKRRAPAWMRRCGLEWAFRLAMEPGRLWRRYLVLYWSGVWLLARDLVRPVPAPRP